LRDTYDAEMRLTKALPKLAKAASSPDLRAAFEAHLEETRGHVDRLEDIFASLEETVRGTHCEGIADNATMDACLIAAGQRAEHYQIAAYGTLVAWAKSMGHHEAADLLQETLDEKKAADGMLTSLAEDGINQDAADAAHPSDAGDDDQASAPARSRATPARRPLSAARRASSR
jgi:ferritin-like metal-binding protein YciE